MSQSISVTSRPSTDTLLLVDLHADRRQVLVGEDAADEARDEAGLADREPAEHADFLLNHASDLSAPSGGDANRSRAGSAGCRLRSGPPPPARVLPTPDVATLEVRPDRRRQRRGARPRRAPGSAARSTSCGPSASVWPTIAEAEARGAGRGQARRASRDRRDQRGRASRAGRRRAVTRLSRTGAGCDSMARDVVAERRVERAAASNRVRRRRAARAAAPRPPRRAARRRSPTARRRRAQRRAGRRRSTAARARARAAGRARGTRPVPVDARRREAGARRASRIARERIAQAGDDEAAASRVVPTTTSPARRGARRDSASRASRAVPEAAQTSSATTTRRPRPTRRACAACRSLGAVLRFAGTLSSGGRASSSVLASP